MPYFQTKKGRKVYYEQYGQKGAVLLLLHGLGASSRSWTHLIKALHLHYQIYALDFPGHGQSEHWERYSLDEFVELINEWMLYCGVSKATLVGISISCSIVLTFAIRYPERVDALILEGPLGGYLPWWRPLNWLDQVMFKSLPIVFQCSVSLFGHQATAHWLNTFGIKKKRSFKSLESIQSLVDFKVVRQLLWQSAHPPYIGQLHLITIPVLLVRGQNDPVPKRFVDYIKEHLSDVKMVEVPMSRHLVALERPQIFNQLVLDFLTHLEL